MASNYLVPGGELGASLATQFSQINKSASVTQACAQTLILQSPMTNGLLATLPEDEALAAEHAREYQNGGGFGYASGTINTLKSVAVSIGALLGNSTAELADELDLADPSTDDYKSDLKNFRFVLDSIESVVSTDQGRQNNFTRMINMTSDLRVLTQSIDDDYVRLETAMQEAEDQNLIGKLKQQQEDLQAQLAEINGQIAAGAVDKIPDAIAFGFEIGSLVLGGEVAGGIVGGAVSVYGFGKEVAAYNSEISETYKKQAEIGRQIVSVTTQIATDKADYATLTLLAAQIKIFQSQVAEVLALMEGFQSELRNWLSSVDLLGEFNTPETEGFFGSQVKSGERFWSRSATMLERFGTIAVNTGPDRSLLHMG